MNVGDKVVRYIGENLMRPEIWQIESIEHWGNFSSEKCYQMYRLIRINELGDVNEVWVPKVTPLSAYMINFL